MAEDPIPAPVPTPPPLPQEAPIPAPDPRPNPPPQTRYEGFWERSVTQGAVLTTILAIFPALRAIFISGESWVPVLINLGEDVVTTWAVALGVTRISSPGLRRIA